MMTNPVSASPCLLSTGQAMSHCTPQTLTGPLFYFLDPPSTSCLFPTSLICFCFVVWFLVFQDRVSLYSPGCPVTHSVDHAGLGTQKSTCLCLSSAGIKGARHPALPSLGLFVCLLVGWLFFFFFYSA